MILMIFHQQKTAQRPSSRANGFLKGSSYFKASSSFFSWDKDYHFSCSLMIDNQIIYLMVSLHSKPYLNFILIDHYHHHHHHHHDHHYHNHHHHHHHDYQHLIDRRKDDFRRSVCSNSCFCLLCLVLA